MKFTGARCIFSSESGLRVYENFFYRWLTLDYSSTTIQTALNRRFPQKSGLHYIDPLIFAVKKRPASCCLLGLGGGAIAHNLAYSHPELRLTAVELSEEVIEVAKKFFKLDSLTLLTTVHQEASVFVAETALKFHHLLVDMGAPLGFPETCNNQKFFENCKRVLEPEGILAVNLGNRDEHLSLYHLIKEVFPKSIAVIPVKKSSNLIVLTCNSSSNQGLLGIFDGDPKVKNIQWTEKWGWVIVFK